MTAPEAPAAAAAAASWRNAAREALRLDLPAWLFVAKTILAALLALWLGFRFNLDNASSAMITVFIVAQPHSGNVLAKGYYRVLGTLIGLLVTIALLDHLAQMRNLFVAAVCLWIGLCVTGAAYFRSFQSYAFLLAGYTSCLIGFPAVLDPEYTFEIALSRVSVVLLGILCATLVAEALWPQRLADVVVMTVRGRYREFAGFVAQTLASRIDHAMLQRAHSRFMADVMALETQRGVAYFEDPNARVRDARLRLFNAEFMTATTRLHALHQWMERLRREQRHAVLAAIRPGYALLAQALWLDGRAPANAAEAPRVLQQLEAVAAPLQAALAHGSAALADAADRLDAACARDLLLRFHGALCAFTEAYASLAQGHTRAPRQAPRLHIHTDPLAAAMTGLRATLTLLLLCSFWIATAWPNGASVTSIATVVCALFAQSPAPLLSAKQMLQGFALGWLAAFVCAFAILPDGDGFPLLAACMIPVLMFSLRLVTIPAYAGIGTGFNLIYIIELAPQNPMRFDVLQVLNDGFAQLIGVALAGIAFSTLVPHHLPLLRRRKLRALREQVRLAATASLRGLSHRVESLTRDLLLQLLGDPQRPQAEDSAILSTALSVLEIGDALIDLRRSQRDAGLDSLTRRRLQRCAQRLADAFETPTVHTRMQALNAIDAASLRLHGSDGDAVPPSRCEDAARAQLLRNLHRIRRALLDPDTATADSAPAAAAPATP